MALQNPLGSKIGSTRRAWQGHYVRAAARSATGKSFLGLYVSSVDNVFATSQQLIDDMIAQSGVTVADIQTALASPIQPITQANDRADIVKALLWSIQRQGGRITCNKPAVLQWLSSLFAAHGGNRRPGGAPAPMVATLRQFCGEQGAALFTPRHSQIQASAFPPDIPFLTVDLPCVLAAVDALNYHGMRFDRLSDPTVQNYPFEYSPSAPLTYGPGPDDFVVARGPDRLICVTPYAFYPSGGAVVLVGPIARIFQFPGLTDAECDACIPAVARAYQYMAVTGLQRADRSAFALIEGELKLLRSHGVTIHVELSGPGHLTPPADRWLLDMIPLYICSIGVNHEELPDLCQRICGRTQASIDPQTRIRRYLTTWDLYQDARALAEALQVKRLYLHAHAVDLVLRRAPVDESSMQAEIEADLYAKLNVLNWLRSTVAAPVRLAAGFPLRGLEDFLTFMGQAAGPAGRAMSDWVKASWDLAKQGHFTVHGDYAVAGIPPQRVLAAHLPRLSTTTAGDRSSVVSFIQSCFTQPAS
jgi:hypothetical protein